MRERLRQIVRLGGLSCLLMLMTVFGSAILGYNQDYYFQFIRWEPVRVVEDPSGLDFTVGLIINFVSLMIPLSLFVAAVYLICDTFVPSNAIMTRWTVLINSIIAVMVAVITPMIQYVADFYIVDDTIFLTLIALNSMMWVLQNMAVGIMMGIATYYLRQQVARGIWGILALSTTLVIILTLFVNYPTENENPAASISAALPIVWMVIVIAVIINKLSTQPIIPIDEQQTITPTRHQ